MLTKPWCDCADLARRLRAAADGGDYQEGLSDDEEGEDDDNDAEISEMEDGLGPQQHTADDRMHTFLAEEQEEQLDIMHSPAGQPWGAEVRTVPLLLCDGHAAASALVYRGRAGGAWPTMHSHLIVCRAQFKLFEPSTNCWLLQQPASYRLQNEPNLSALCARKVTRLANASLPCKTRSPHDQSCTPSANL